MSRNHIVTAKPVDKIYTSRYHQHYTYELILDYKIHWLQVTFLRYVLTTSNFEPLSHCDSISWQWGHSVGRACEMKICQWQLHSRVMSLKTVFNRLGVCLTDQGDKKNCYTRWLGVLYPNITGLALTKRKFLCSQVWRLGIQDQGCSFKRIQRRVTSRPLITDKWSSLWMFPNSASLWGS